MVTYKHFLLIYLNHFLSVFLELKTIEVKMCHDNKFILTKLTSLSASAFLI